MAVKATHDSGADERAPHILTVADDGTVTVTCPGVSVGGCESWTSCPEPGCQADAVDSQEDAVYHGVPHVYCPDPDLFGVGTGECFVSTYEGLRQAVANAPQFGCGPGSWLVGWVAEDGYFLVLWPLTYGPEFWPVQTPQQVKDEALRAVRKLKWEHERVTARARALRRAMHAAALAAKDRGARDEELADAMKVGVGMAQKVIAEQRGGNAEDVEIAA